MKEEFWKDKWEANSIGFHRDETHPHLVKYLSHFNVDDMEKSVLVPLCGKSLDLKYLAEQGFNVVGIEFSEIACEQFFKENQISFETEEGDGFKYFYSEKIHLFSGDFFRFVPKEKLNFAYDRAAMVAIDPADREKYAKKYAECLNPGGKLLLITFEYDQSKCQGPPWSTEEYFVYEFFEKDFDLELLEAVDVEIGNPRMQEAGVSTALQKVFLLTRK